MSNDIKENNTMTSNDIKEAKISCKSVTHGFLF